MYTLLIVDDEDLVRRGIKALVDFEKLSIDTVLEASNGLEALELFDSNKVQLVIMDINMPKMNGLELAKAIKTRDDTVKIAMLTGYDYFDYAVTALKTGVDDYILKPVSKKDVSELLIKLITKLEQERTSQEIGRVVESLTKDQVSEDDHAYKAVIKEKVDSQLMDPQLSLTVLADQMGFSAGYLSGLFKTLFGVNFQDYVLGMRLEKAKLLILTSEMKNYEIAEAVGFDDVSYFGTRFKKQFGLSPKQYKQRVRHGHDEGESTI